MLISRGSPDFDGSTRWLDRIVDVRSEFNFSSYLRFAYTSQWINLSSASRTSRFDVISAEFGWMF